MNRARYAQKTQLFSRVELGSLGLLLVLFGLSLSWPAAMPAFVLLCILLSVALTGWQYRSMDEFKRQRFVKAWAVTGVFSFAPWTGGVLWRGFSTAKPTPGQLPSLTLSFWQVYLVWASMFADHLCSVGYLYRRDPRG